MSNIVTSMTVWDLLCGVLTLVPLSNPHQLPYAHIFQEAKRDRITRKVGHKDIILIKNNGWKHMLNINSLSTNCYF